jgi:DNA-binding NtrC family response regulator
LEDNRFVVHAFDDPRLALENFRKDLYNLLILDIIMEKMNGLELYKEIKKIDNKIKVCFLTASQFNYRAVIDVLGNLEENQFIQKPIENDKLIKIINEITG